MTKIYKRPCFEFCYAQNCGDFHSTHSLADKDYYCSYLRDQNCLFGGEIIHLFNGGDNQTLNGLKHGRFAENRKTVYYKLGKPHRLKKPAVIYDNGTSPIEFWENGKRIRRPRN